MLSLRTRWQLRPSYGTLVACCTVTLASAQSFESQFSSPVYYALTVAAISLGTATIVALLGLLIFCLVRRQKRLGRKPMRLDTEASSSNSSRQREHAADPLGSKPTRTPAVGGTNGGGGGSGSGTKFVGGGMALPLPAAAAAAAQKPGTGGAGGSQGSAGLTAAALKYTHSALESRDSGGGGGGSGGGGSRGSGGAVGMYRHSSLLRPVPYASLESSQKSHGSGSSPDRPVITHGMTRTSPAATLQPLDPRHYLSHGAINLAGSASADASKRMSYAEPSSLLQQRQQENQPAKLEKRLSYAEKRAQIGSNIELSSGQVFLASSLQRQQHSAQQPSLQPVVSSLPRFVLQPSTLATQPEEATVASNGAAGDDDRHRPNPRLNEGPSFPRTTPKPPAPKQLPQPKPPPPPPQPTESPKATSPLPPDRADQPPRNGPKNLRRFQLGGGVGDDGDVDRRSVASTVLKQEAIQAFDFLDNYADEN